MRTSASARTWALGLAMAVGVPVGAQPGCTLLLGTEAVQCRDNTGCARFPGSVCDVTNGVCVPRPTPQDGSTNSDGALTADTRDAAVEASLPAGEDGAAERTDTSPADITAPAERVASGSGSDGHANGLCPDLDQNGVMDCRESLLANPDFAVGATGWTAEFGVSQAAPGNAVTGTPASGAIAISNTNQSNTAGSSMAGSAQCVPARPDVSYALFAEVLIPVDQNPMTLAGAGLQSFLSPDCSGAPNSVVTPSLVAVTASAGNWQEVHAMLPTPAGTASISVRLVVVKPFVQDVTQALFDNVLLKAR